jgi:hypothetical protein
MADFLFVGCLGEPLQGCNESSLIIGFAALQYVEDFMRDDYPYQSLGVFDRMTPCHEPLEGLFGFGWRTIAQLVFNNFENSDASDGWIGF